VIVDGYSPVPFADFWGQFPFLERALGGDVRLGDLWAQSNEHRIFLARLEFLADYRWFGGTFVFLFTLIGVSLLLVAVVAALAVWLGARDRVAAWGTFCVAAILALSPAAEENLTWSFQVAFVQVYLFAALALLALVVSRGRAPWLAVTCVAAIAATYSLANGLLLWPVLVLLALALRLGRREVVVLSVVGAATIVSYVWHFHPVERHASYVHTLGHPIGLAKYSVVFLGSPIREAGVSAAGAVGAVGVLLFAALLVDALRARARTAATTWYGAALALFVVVTAVETGIGRLNFGVSQALSSRYATPGGVFWLGLVIGFLASVGSRLRAPLYLGLAAAAAFAVSVTSRPNRSTLQQTVVGKELAVVAFRSGVDDPARTVTGLPSSAVVDGALRWLRDQKLGPWAPGGMVDGSRASLATAPIARRCSGTTSGSQSVRGGVRYDGTVAPPPQASDDLVVRDEAGAERGFGLTRTGGADDFVAYARGAQGRAEIVLVASDHRTALCRIVPD